MTSKIRVAVLRGGPSSEYDVSLKTGATVLKHLPEKYEGLDVLIDKAGLWHIRGVPKSPERILNHADVVWNALHGFYGEDGQVQHILQTHAIPFTGSDSFASSLGMNKVASKNIFAQNDMKTPTHVLIHDDDDIEGRVHEIFKTFLMPAVVKPASAGSSVGVSIVHTIPELKEGIEQALRHSRTALIEEYIRGVEATCGVIQDFRDEPIYALMPVEIRPHLAVASGGGGPRSSTFFDYNSKYENGGSEEICPGNFSEADKAIITNYARRAHQALGLRHYSRSDFIVTPKRGVYILETNTLPGLTEQSLLPKSLAAGGTSLPFFLDHVLQLAMR